MTLVTYGLSGPFERKDRPSAAQHQAAPRACLSVDYSYGFPPAMNWLKEAIGSLRPSGDQRGTTLSPLVDNATSEGEEVTFPVAGSMDAVYTSLNAAFIW